MSAPDMNVIEALMAQAREVLHDESLALLMIGDDRTVIPYHIDAGGSRWVELQRSDAAWLVQRDDCDTCLSFMITGADGEFRELQRILYVHEQR